MVRGYTLPLIGSTRVSLIHAIALTADSPARPLNAPTKGKPEAAGYLAQ